MNRTYGTGKYTTCKVEDRKARFSGLELYREVKETPERIARILFWDADGHFYLETFDEVPLIIAEEFIEEAKSAVKVA